MDFCSIPVAGKLCDAADAIDFVSDPGKAITQGIGDWIAKSTGQLAAAAADLAAEAVNKTTNIDLGAGWFRDNYELILPIGLVLLVATFCAQLIRAAIRRDGQALAQAFTGTMSGVLFAFSAIALTTVAIEVVDALSDGLFKAADSSLSDAVRRMVKVSQIGALGPLGWLVCAFCGIGAAIGAFLYWCVMMVRKVGILVMVTLAVFAGAGGGWEVARRWRRGWIEATATLICSKLLMTVVFLLGISAMGKTDAKDGLGALADVMSGIVIMILVLLCPYATFKFVHWAAEGTNGEDIHRAGGAGAQLAKQHAERAARKGAQAAATAGTGGAAAGAGAAGGAAPQGPDIPGGFPGDIAPTTSGGQSGNQGGDRGSPGGSGGQSGLEKAVQPPPTRPTDDTSGHFGGGPGQGGGGHGGPGSAASGQGGGWMSAPPTGATPPPQGAPPAPNTGDAANGPATPTPPATGI
ncbi:type IV secretion system protein [Streptomyces sp. ET3-23]|uniref:SCO6881 family protein n=1 Tax=Streptomyces sp. ET3-23 TaxID=2885643 RepID=UPI001D10CF68|nr:type IV secretion system protein [Streptomyces sp. ET3-23]MCC2276214.1 type IV secretion system protein [Streptomyces sp. ET3-23]